MGLFGRSKFEQQLLDLCTAMLVAGGAERSEAEGIAKDILKQAKELTRKEDTSRVPENFGDFLLREEQANPKIAEKLEKARRGGAEDDDIRAYWNAHPLERAILFVSNNQLRAQSFMASLGEGKGPEDASRTVNKCYPMFGDPDDTEHGSGDDRPLPDELNLRVGKLWPMIDKDPQGVGQRMESASSFNAFVRAEIRAGNL